MQTFLQKVDIYFEFWPKLEVQNHFLDSELPYLRWNNKDKSINYITNYFTYYYAKLNMLIRI